MINGNPASVESNQKFVFRYEYDGSNNVIYSGFAPVGSAVGDKWQLSKYTYTSANCTLIERGVDTWTNRASASYG